MASKTSTISMRDALVTSGHRINIAIPLSAVVICIAAQYFFTDYFVNVPFWPLFICVLGISGLITAEFLNSNPARGSKIAVYVLLHAISIVLLAILMPLPSPYLIYIVLIAMLMYFDFGLKPMIYSLALVFASLFARFLFFDGPNAGTDNGIFLVTLTSILVITYYAVVFLRFAHKEMESVRLSSEASLQHRQEVDSLINNITDGVIAVDSHHKVTTYNGAALDVLDLNTNIKGRQLSRILKPINAESQPVSIAQLLKEATAPTINRDLRIKYADGSTANLFLAISPIYLGYGKSENNGYTMLLRDITREKSLEEERDEFISVVSHELRTPIAISEGNISNAEFVVEKGADMNLVKESLKEAHRQILFLADMINDLSTLSRAERGVLEVDLEAINIHELCQELQNNYTQSAESKGLKLGMEVDPNLELLNSSKLYVREILQNYITNAIKYTESGSVTISAKATDRGVNFAIRDTGIGISKADQDRVFDKFFRSEDFRTRKSNGTGLGLYVTMKLMRLIHAEVNITSELNKGSTFTIFIPDLSA
ncbi:MAG: domain S-box protein [Candidatus Saccharibacteria bacterium]|nr:domain S-box protein [Candidatus Saccharibacteria bacterium]